MERTDEAPELEPTPAGASGDDVAQVLSAATRMSPELLAGIHGEAVAGARNARNNHERDLAVVRAVLSRAALLEAVREVLVR